MTKFSRLLTSVILLVALSTVFFVDRAQSQVIQGNILVNPNPIVFDTKNLQEKKLVKIAYCSQIGLATQPVVIKITNPPDNNGPIKLGKHELTFAPDQITPCSSPSKAQELGVTIDPAGIPTSGQFIGRITLAGGGATVTVGVSASGTSLPVPNAPSTAPDPAVDPNAVNQDCGMGRVENCTLADYVANQNGFVYKSWVVMRTAVNILLVIALLAIAFSNITRISIDTYTIKKALPNLLLGIILANASMYIIRFLADMATVATYFFVNLSGETTFREFITTAVVSLSLQTVFTIGGSIASPVTGSIVALLVGIVFLVLLLWLAFLLYFRLAVVYLLTIISPVAFIAYGLPGMDRFFKQWWQQFVKWMFMVVAMAAVFWVMILVGGSSDNQSIASILIQIVLFITAVTMPTKLGGAVMDKASKAFMKYTGANAARDASIDYAKTKANQIGYRIPGVARTKEWFKLGKEAADKDIEQLKKRGRVRAQSGSLGRNIQKLKHLDSEINDQEAEMIALKADEAAKLSGGLFDRDKRGITERKLLAEFRKRKAEERTKAEEGAKRLDFLGSDDGDIKSLLREVFQATIDQEVATNEVKRAEIMKKGGISNEYLQPLQAAMNYADLREEWEAETDQGRKDEIKKAMDEIEDSFNKLKDRNEYRDEYGQFKDIKDFLIVLKPSDTDKQGDRYKELLGEEGKSKTDSQTRLKNQIDLLQGRHRQTLKMFNEGVAGQIADDVKEQSVAQIERELDKYFTDTLGKYKTEDVDAMELRRLFMQGDTARLSALGVDANDIRSGRVVVEKLKTIMRSTNDVRNKDALSVFAKVHNESFNADDAQQAKYMFSQTLVDNANSTDTKARRSAAGEIFQIAGSVAGQPYLINQNAHPVPDGQVAQPQVTLAPPTPPVPPTFPDGYSGSPSESKRLKKYERDLKAYNDALQRQNEQFTDNQQPGTSNGDQDEEEEEGIDEETEATEESEGDE